MPIIVLGVPACTVLYFHLSCIQVTQYSCQYTNLAPRGCTQYFFDSTANNIQTFNYNNGNGHHLAQQDQAICIRRERGNCRICYYAVAQTDFQTAGILLCFITYLFIMFV